jgi:predicted PurR-regulated permease PerM
MIVIILSSILLAYVSFPVYKRISKKISNKFTSIILSLLIVMIIILIPFAFLAFEVTQQGYIFYHSLSDKIEKGAVFGFGCNSADSKVCALLNQAEAFSAERLTTFGFNKQLPKLLPIIEEKITIFILTIPIIIAEIILILTISYFILKDWENLLKKTLNLLPMKQKSIKRLIIEFGDITYTVVYAQLFVAFIQGLVGTLGYYAFGVPFPVILGILTAFCTLIPTAGTALIWLPASLFLIVGGYLTNDQWMLYRGIGLLIYSFFIINLIDNFLLAKIVHARAKVSQVSVIIGVICGAAMFGIVGIFIGPILLPLMITYFETFKERFV